MSVVEAEKPDQPIREKIVDALTVYPIVSPSQLQTKIGPGIPVKMWRPVLESMITEGIVLRWNERHTLSNKQERVFTKLALAEHPNGKNAFRVMQEEM